MVNLEKVLKEFDNIGNIDVFPPIKDGATMIQRTAKELVPRRTSYLYNHITVTVNKRDKWCLIKASAEYAIYVEFGTYKMKAQPYFVPAVTRNAGKIKKNMRDYIKNELKRIT